MLRVDSYCIIYNSSCHAGRLTKYNPSTSIIHKVHIDATSNCHRQQYKLTWRQNSNAVKKKCVTILLVMLNFLAIHTFFTFPSDSQTCCLEPLLSAMI